MATNPLLASTPHPGWSRPAAPLEPGALPAPYRNAGPKHLFARPVPETSPEALTPAELKLVLATVPQVSHGRNAANRNAAIVRLLLWGMLRLSELLTLTWEEIDEPVSVLTVTGKGGKRRQVPIGDPAVWDYLAAYTNELAIPPRARFRGPVVRQLDHDDRPITRHTVIHLLAAVRQQLAGTVEPADQVGRPHDARAVERLLPKLHAHVFRATGATYLAAAGMSLVKLMAILGHASPTTTLRYYVAAEQLELTAEVRRVWAAVTARLDEAGQVSTPDELPDPHTAWYRERHLL